MDGGYQLDTTAEVTPIVTGIFSNTRPRGSTKTIFLTIDSWHLLRSFDASDASTAYSIPLPPGLAEPVGCDPIDGAAGKFPICLACVGDRGPGA